MSDDTEIYGSDDLPVGSQQLIPVGPKFIVSRGSLMLNPKAAKPSHEEFSAGLTKLRKAHESIQFWLGDMLNLGESLFGEEVSQHVDAGDFKESTVSTYQWVAKRVPPENREIAPSFSHCQAVAALPVDQQRKWLRQAHEQDWSVPKLKSEILGATAGGKTRLRYLLIVDCGTEARQEKLAKELRDDGLAVKTQVSAKRAEKKPKKKGDVTAKKSRKTPMNATKRVPQGWDVKTKGGRKKKS